MARPQSSLSSHTTRKERREGKNSARGGRNAHIAWKRIRCQHPASSVPVKAGTEHRETLLSGRWAVYSIGKSKRAALLLTCR